jgi:hypothetical protein
LAELCFSAEGKAHGAKLAGLDAALGAKPPNGADDNSPVEPKLRGLALTQTGISNTPTAASTLDELLAWQDQAFIDCAYQTLLGRDPDDEGLGYYLGRLRTGVSKLQILAQLRLGAEGKAYGANLQGLHAAITRYRRWRLPLVGWLFRLLNGEDGNHPIECRLRDVESQLYLLGKESNLRLGEMKNALAELNEVLIQHARTAVEATGDSYRPAAIESPDPKGLKALAPRARGIYFKLRTEAASHTARVS